MGIKMNNIDLDKLESVLQLMEKYKMDLVEIDGLKLVKTKHDYPSPKTPKPLTDDELLFEHEKWGG